MRANVAYCRKALLAGLLGAAVMPVAVLAASEALRQYATFARIGILIWGDTS